MAREIVRRDPIAATQLFGRKVTSGDGTANRTLMDTEGLGGPSRGQGVRWSRELSGVRCPVGSMSIHDM